ncbi:MAG TPA: phytanoyl-CoA dioxygenase family protein [Armatimonadota bacterium]|nr:phytanoyl-CoA dioxygenase family protein [Armatimonadota bacterium]
MVTVEQVEEFRKNGYVVARGVFPPEEIERLRGHYMSLREKGAHPGDFGGVDPTSADPLKRFPRMIHMHRWDETSLQWLIDARLNEWMTALLGAEPYAVQTMLYFKPAGARGQALHQDQYYLRVQPGTCLAAWMALDDCDEENGCMRVVPGSHDLPVLCTKSADTSVSFTDVTAPIPEGASVTPVEMAAGDVFFFNGSVIHGSYPNVSRDRFRRALIGHYIVGEAEKVASYYHPVLRMDGSEVALGVSQGGGPCGVWAVRDGQPVVEMAEPAGPALALHE